MNVNIRTYNGLVDEMLHNCFPEVWFQGIYSSLDMHGQLSLRLCRPNDKIHLSTRGICKLVTYIKTCVFRREKYDIFNNGPSRIRTKVARGKQESTPNVGSHDRT